MYVHRRARAHTGRCGVGHDLKCVVMFELLTEVTLGLFLHSSDGTVLVCEEELLELGHLVL